MPEWSRGRRWLVAVLLLLPGVAASAQQTALDRSDFRSELRQLWSGQTSWLRLYLVSVMANLPDKDEASKRLQKNTAELGAAFKPFYGDTLGERVSGLLKDQVMLMGLIFESANQGDNTMREPLTERWNASTDTLAQVLSRVNPSQWPLSDLKSTLYRRLELVLAELLARSQKDWVVDVAAHDKTVDHTLKLADRLSGGIVRQFPRRFTR